MSKLEINSTLIRVKRRKRFLKKLYFNIYLNNILLFYLILLSSFCRYGFLLRNYFVQKYFICFWLRWSLDNKIWMSSFHYFINIIFWVSGYLLNLWLVKKKLSELWILKNLNSFFILIEFFIQLIQINSNLYIRLN